MADFQGANKIGFLLGGGARQMKAEAYNEGRLNTAKTEDALAAARLKQLEATAAANAARAKEKWKTDYIAIESTKPGADPRKVARDAEFIGNMIIGGTSGDFHSAMQGRSEQQEIDFRDTLASMDATPEERLRAGFGVQGKVSPDIAPVGTHGVVDLTQEDQVLKGTPGSGTTAMRNFQFSESLPPDKRDDFSPFVGADQIVNAGGVPTARPRTGGPATPVVAPEQVAQNAGDISQAKATGQAIAAQKKDFPAVRMTLDQNKLNIRESNSIAMEVLGNEKLWQAVGPTQLISEIPGTEGRYLRSQIDVLKNKVMLQTLINLRSMSKTGGAVGNVSDAEGKRMEAAIAAISDPNISAGDFRKELGRLIAYNEEFQGNMEAAFNATYDKDGNPIMTQAPRGSEPAAGGEDAGPSIEEIVINNGDGDYDEAGNLVRTDGWIFMRDGAGNAAWVSPDGTQYEEIAQ